MPWISTNDHYTQTADEFETVDEFLEMCAAYGWEVDIRRRGDEWVDERGEVVLRQAEVMA